MKDFNDRFLSKLGRKYRWIRPLFVVFTIAAVVLAFCGFFHIHALWFFHFQCPIMIVVAFVFSMLTNSLGYNATGETERLNKLFVKGLHCSKCRYEGIDASDDNIVTVDYKRVVRESDFKDNYIRTEGNTRYYTTVPKNRTVSDEPFGVTINKPDFTTKCVRCGNVDHWHLYMKEKETSYGSDYIILERNGSKYDDRLLMTESFVHTLNSNGNGRTYIDE